MLACKESASKAPCSLDAIVILHLMLEVGAILELKNKLKVPAGLVYLLEHYQKIVPRRDDELAASNRHQPTLRLRD